MWVGCRVGGFGNGIRKVREMIGWVRNELGRVGNMLGWVRDILLQSLLFFTFSLPFPCLPHAVPLYCWKGILITSILLSPRTSISTDRFSRTDYVVPFYSSLPPHSSPFYDDASL